MIIRRATTQDVMKIRSLVYELTAARSASYIGRMHGFHERNYVSHPIGNADIEREVYIIALTEDDEVVGLVHGSLYDRRHYHLKQLGYVEELFVRE